MPRVTALLLAVLLAPAAACGGSSSEETVPAAPAAQPAGDAGRITARPGRGGGNCRPGVHPLSVGQGREALMRVTPGGRGGRKALLLALHGAGSGGAGGGLYAFRGAWSEPGLVFVAPGAEGSTWSFLRGGDTDLPTVNRALARAFARCRVDPKRIGVGGFSDGATYALTLGVQNGDLFTAVIAQSPGGLVAEGPVGKPRVFIAHGTNDRVLPKAQTSDEIVAELREDGYRVTYRTFRGGHEVVPEITRQAVRWLERR